jgi:hypothetical protein
MFLNRGLLCDVCVTGGASLSISLEVVLGMAEQAVGLSFSGSLCQHVCVADVTASFLPVVSGSVPCLVAVEALTVRLRWELLIHGAVAHVTVHARGYGVKRVRFVAGLAELMAARHSFPAQVRLSIRL